MHDELVERTRARLDTLCLAHPDRHVGGQGNSAANDFFEREVQAAGMRIERIPFACVDWEYTDAWLKLDGLDVPLRVGPYSPPFDDSARLTTVSTIEELEGLKETGDILLLHGPIAADQVTPRNYPFYQMDEHVRLLAALDAAAPAAVIAATDRTAMAHAVSPFPLFEDADLGFPSAYLLHTAGHVLVEHHGERVSLRISSRQTPASGEQLVARTDGGGRRVIVSAHIDSRHGTPGALDNATGVCVLMALADILSRDAAPIAVELLPFNGEDNFAAYGEMAYLEAYGDGLADVVLAINIDAAGRSGDMSAVSFYACPDELRQRVAEQVTTHPRIVEGPEWPMSDHMVFAMRGVPAAALTSTGLYEISAEVAHTAKDVPELADPSLIVQTAEFIRDVIGSLA